MNKELNDAFKKSIQKWEDIVYRNGADGGRVDCALCELFYDDAMDICENCPITEKVGGSGCTEPPYLEWVKYQRKSGYDLPCFVFDEKSKSLAMDELLFLKSLYSEYLEKEVKESPITHYFEESSAVIDSITESIDVIERMAKGIYDSQLGGVGGGKLLIAGNGGSCAQAEHFAGEMTCTFNDPNRRTFNAVSLANTAMITAWSNDFGFDGYFTRQVEAFGRFGDILFLISTGGGRAESPDCSAAMGPGSIIEFAPKSACNSMNLVEAGEKALEMGLKVYSIVGKTGGELAKISDECIVVPSFVTSHIQEAHIAIIHAICEYLDYLCKE